MTGTMREIIWIAGSLPVWIALELAETGLYIYLVTGILPDLRNTGRREKLLCGILFAVMAGMICMKYRIAGVSVRASGDDHRHMDRMPEKSAA